MTTQELKQYIDRVLGNSIRCLLPSYWWKRLFGMVVDEVDKVSTKTATLNSEFKSEVKNINSEVAELKSKAKENYLLYIGDNLTEYEIQFNKETVKILRSLIAHDDNAFYRFDYNEFCNLIVYVEYNDRYYPCVPLTVFINSSTGWLCVVCTYPDSIIEGNKNKTGGISKLITSFLSSGKIFAKEVISGNTVDTSLSTTSTNPVQNKVITSALDSKVDKAALDVSNLTTYQEYANAFEAAGYGDGDYYISFKFKGLTAYRVIIERKKYKITIYWISIDGSFWESTISQYNYNGIMQHRCDYAGAFIYIGSEMSEDSLNENVEFLKWSMPTTKTTIVTPYGLCCPIRITDKESGSSALDITIFNSNNQLETWRVNKSDGTSSLLA